MGKQCITDSDEGVMLLLQLTKVVSEILCVRFYK